MALMFLAKIEVEGKPDPKPWKDNEGRERLSYKLNVSQNDGRDVATVKCDEKTYDSVRRHDVLEATFSYTERNGSGNLKLECVELLPVASSGLSGPSSQPVSSGQSVSSGQPVKK